MGGGGGGRAHEGTVIRRLGRQREREKACGDGEGGRRGM